MKREWLGLLAAGAFLVACGGDDAGDAAASAQSVAGSQTAAAPSVPDSTPEVQSVPAPEGSLAGEPMILGSEDATITIVEYASVTCPACAYFHTNVFPEIKEKYIDTGKVRFEFREFPTNPENLAYAGFYLSRCAATQNGAPAYFAMLKTLFEQQRDWAYGPEPGATLQNIAAQAGIDRTGLEQCFYREDVKSAVRQNVVTGIEQDKVRGTPTFMVDGKEFDWGRSAESMGAAIDAELAKRAAE